MSESRVSRLLQAGARLYGRFKAFAPIETPNFAGTNLPSIAKALKENQEILVRTRGEIFDSAVRVNDLHIYDLDIQRTVQYMHENFNFVSYGGLYLATPPLAVPAITALAWTKLSVFDTVTFAEPKRVVQDIPSQTLAIAHLGQWNLSVFITLEHDEYPSSIRQLWFRLYNETDAVAVSQTFVHGVPKSAGVSTFSMSVPFDAVNATNLNDQLSIQISGDTNFSALSCLAARYSLHHIGPYPYEFRAGKN